MAKAKQAPAITSSSDLYGWAAEVLRLRFDEVVSFSGAVTVAWNVNGVHDMRVALRRLRTALRDFVQVIDSKSLKRVKDDLKKVADSLGEVRDLDVAMIALEDLCRETDDEAIKNGIAALSQELRIDRENAHARAQKTLESISVANLRNRFSRGIEDSLRQRELFRPSDLAEVGRRVIETRIQEISSLGSSIYMPFDGLQLHDLRIAAKRLRYAIELFGPGWTEEIAGFAKEMSKLQSYLGEVHDCDLWIEKLSVRLTEKESRRAGHSAISLAAAWLLSKFVEKRGKEYCKAVDLWREWTANDFFGRLKTGLAQ